MRLSPRFIALGAAGTAVVAAVAFGLVLLGSPAQERERRIDARRVADLHGIAAATDLHWSRHSRLPASLDDLAAAPGLRINTRDPVSSETYGYEALDSLRYEVCATFDGESPAGSGEPTRVHRAEPREPTTIPPVVQISCQGCHAAARIRVDDPVTGQFNPRDLWTHGIGRQCFQLQVR